MRTRTCKRAWCGCARLRCAGSGRGGRRAFSSAVESRRIDASAALIAAGSGPASADAGACAAFTAISLAALAAALAAFLAFFSASACFIASSFCTCTAC